MIIYVCDRCSKQEEETSGSHATWGLCEPCCSEYGRIRDHMNSYTAQILDAWKRHDTMPVMKKLW
jgi:hypothetical protein